jgi:TonB-linked SusC/RagA family outer membrane protein
MKKPLLFFLLILLGVNGAVLAQDRTVSGKVTSGEDGSSLPGVNVVIKGTTRGMVTNPDGNYTIAVPANATLSFSFVGFASKEVAVGSQTSINVSLEPDSRTLGEVVVTALGIQKEKKGLGFSEKTLNNTELTVARTTNVANALSGKVAGVRVAGNNGMTGSSSAIFIRGFTTFTGSNQPLFVIDGIPIDNGGGSQASQTGVSNSNRGIDINQDDIETMSVLKGPAAAALYGSRAAAGAIIITTKKGKANANKKITLNYTGSYNVVEVNRFPDYQNEFGRGTSLSGTGVPQAPVYQPNADQASWGPAIDGRLVPSAYSAADRTLFNLPAEVPLTAYPNNVRDMFRQGYNMQHNFSLSGATDKNNYYFSYNNLNEKGFMEGNDLTRHTFTANASSQLTKRLNIGTNIQYINNSSNRSQIGNQLSNPLFRGWFMPRDYDLKNEPSVRPDGSQVFFNANTDNPYWTLRNNLYSDERNRLIGNVNLNYEITPALSFNSRAGVDVYSEGRKTIDAIGARGQANHAAQGVGAIGDRTIVRSETSFYNNLVFKKDINNDLKVSALLGNEINMQNTTDNLVVGNTLVTRGYNNIANATNFVPTNDRFQSALIGVYGNVDLSYKGWLNVTVTGRNDWSSTFKAGSRSYFYPSVSGSVILSELFPSIAEGNGLSFAKIKSSWARVGRVAPIFGTDTYYSAANPADGFGPQIVFPFLGSQGRSLDNVSGNPQLGPEFTNSFEIGGEFKFLKKRIGLEVTYFNTRSTDIILNVPIAAASGFTSQARNAGELNSYGWEWDLNIRVVDSRNFKWDIGFNGATVKNDVVSLAPGVQNISLGPFTTAEGRIQAGLPYGTIFANTLLRTTEGKLVVNASGLPIADPRGVQQVGNPNPNWTGGVSNTISYKGLTLNFLIDMKMGGDILSRVIGDIRRTGVGAETVARPRLGADGLPLRNYVIDGVVGGLNADGTVRVDSPTNSTAITAQQYWSNLYAFNFPGMYVMDGTWTRLREASLSYTLPKKLLEKTPFGNVEIGVNGRNLLLWTDVPYIDPEVSIGTNNGNTQGIEFNTLPQSRTFGVFARLSF